MAQSFSLLAGLPVWGLVCLAAAILAVRGRSYWATRMMLVGAILQVVGAVVAIAGMFLAFGSMGSAGGSATELSSLISGILIVMALLAPAGGLVFLIGLLGLCARYGTVEKRAAELEQLTQQLGARLQG